MELGAICVKLQPLYKFLKLRRRIYERRENLSLSQLYICRAGGNMNGTDFLANTAGLTLIQLEIEVNMHMSIEGLRVNGNRNLGKGFLVMTRFEFSSRPEHYATLESDISVA